MFEGSPQVVMCVYQHVWSSAKTPQQNRSDRGHVLASLSKALRQIPSRLSLVVAGDFNSTLFSCLRLVGPRVCPEAGRPDSEGFQELIASHNLVALNTWHALCPHTFSQQDSTSQIDFVLTKEIQAGGPAKQAQPLEDWHLGSWKTGGHIPILATIRPIGHWQLTARAPASAYDSKALQHAVREHTDDAQNMKEWVRRCMPASHPDECNRILLEATARFFPERRHAAPTGPDAQGMWRLVRELRATPSPDQALRDELATAQHRHKQLVKQRQKERAQQFLKEVDEAIAEGSSYVAYSTLKQLRPWQPPRRAQLKNKDGTLMSSADELHALRDFAKDTFGVHEALPERTQPVPPMAPDLLAKHIKSIKPHKAVPKDSAPAAAWKLCAEEVSPSLSSYLASVEQEPLASGVQQAGGQHGLTLAGMAGYGLAHALVRTR